MVHLGKITCKEIQAVSRTEEALPTGITTGKDLMEVTEVTIGEAETMDIVVDIMEAMARD